MNTIEGHQITPNSILIQCLSHGATSILDGVFYFIFHISRNSFVIYSSIYISSLYQCIPARKLDFLMHHCLEYFQPFWGFFCKMQLTLFLLGIGISAFVQTQFKFFKQSFSQTQSFQSRMTVDFWGCKILKFIKAPTYSWFCCCFKYIIINPF